MPLLQVQLHNSIGIALNAEFSCAPGEMVALLGPSGSGKSSLLRAVAGLLNAPGLTGRVSVGGQVWFDSQHGVCLTPQQRRVGLVFQQYALFPHLSAMENIAVGAHNTWANDHLNAEASAMMVRLGLSGLEHRLPAQLSGGQQQRVALGRALMRVQPCEAGGQAAHGVLLLDEPFSAVDAPTRQTLHRELAVLRKHVSTPIVLVTHDLQEARRLADRVVILDAGTTLQAGTPANVFARPRNARVAQLVGIQNLFKGRFYRGSEGWGTLHWSARTQDGQTHVSHLRVIDKGRIDDGAQVGWVLAPEAIQVMDIPQAAQSTSADSDNVLHCAVQEVMELGETSLCTLVPGEVPEERLMVTLATSQVRSHGWEAGGQVLVQIAPQAIHIMPVRT